MAYGNPQGLKDSSMNGSRDRDAYDRAETDDTENTDDESMDTNTI